MKPNQVIDRRTVLGAAIGALCVGALPRRAGAEEWLPKRPVQVVVPFAAGGATDIAARILAEAMAEPLKKPVIVENRGGAAGNIGAQAVARAEPDGLTLLFGTVGLLTTNPFIYKNMGFDPIKDLTPISMVYTSDLVLVVKSDFPAKTIAEFVSYAKTQPGKLSYGSSGVGASTHTAMELFKLVADLNIAHIPYRGSGAAVTDLLGGAIQMMMVQVPTVISSIKNGELRALVVTGERRNPLLPDVPTMAEAGFQGADATAWGGLLAPAGTPPQIIAALNAAVVSSLNKPAVRDRITATGLEAVSSTPEEMARIIATETQKWQRVVKEAGISAF